MAQNNGTAHAGVPANVYVTDGIKSLASTGLDKRDGALATMEWKPTRSFTSTWMPITPSANGTTTGAAWRPISATIPHTTNYSNLDIVDNTLIGATVRKSSAAGAQFSIHHQRQIFAAGWNNNWTPTPGPSPGISSYSHATRDEKDYETQATYQDGTTDTGTIFIPPASGPTFGLQNGYTDPSKVLVGHTIYGAGYSRFPHVVDELKSARVDVSRNLDSWFSSVAAGLNYDDRTKHKIQPEAG